MSGKKLLPVVALLGIIVLCAVSVSLLLIHSGSVPASTSSTQRTLVIDAGHGGIDGGAISAPKRAISIWRSRCGWTVLSGFVDRKPS